MTQYDPDGAGRIATEDFLIAIDTDDFVRNSEVAKKRAALKRAVLEYGTSFITIEEFVKVVSRYFAACQEYCQVYRSSIGITRKLVKRTVTVALLRSTEKEKLEEGVSHF